jgi:hypothetical protein
MRRVVATAICLLLANGHAPVHAQAADSVTIYRCTDANGRQSLRDSPCPRGQAQQAREMVRPKDAPPAAVRGTPPAIPSVGAPPPIVAYRTPPQPMYQCTTPDGARYTSETGDGNPRWVPFWTLGDPYDGDRTWRYGAGRGTFRRAPPLPAGISIPRSPPVPSPPAVPPGHRHPLPWPVASGGGQWIRDTCVQMPPGEVCALLRDRRDAIRTRFFNAQETERNALRREERAINARLANDCGAR